MRVSWRRVGVGFVGWVLCCTFVKERGGLKRPDKLKLINLFPKMKKFSTSRLCLVALGLGGLSLLASCSAQDSPVVSVQEEARVALQQRGPIAVGESVSLEGVNATAYELVSAGDKAVAEVSLTDKGLQVQGLRSGWTTVQVAPKGAAGRAQSVALYVTGQRPLLATEYFAPGNVSADGRSFAQDDVKGSGYFTYDEASALRLTHQGKAYRLPTKTELHALLPYEEMLEYRRQEFRSYLEKVTLDGETKTYQETFYTPGRNVAYAIRFERPAQQGEGRATDNSRRTAFRYAYVQVDGVYRLQITARYLGEHFLGDINYVASEGFWSSYTWDDKTIELPALGVRDPEGKVSSFAALGEYWSASEGYDDLSASALGFGTSAGSSTIHADRAMERPVRLILDAPSR